MIGTTVLVCIRGCMCACVGRWNTSAVTGPASKTRTVAFHFMKVTCISSDAILSCLKHHVIFCTQSLVTQTHMSGIYLLYGHASRTVAYVPRGRKLEEITKKLESRTSSSMDGDHA
mmetsp:Transcript_24442/g.68122  ORF Transcript_24442/g.68122 Transcript_24442/m.68122 type:complete len:116 (+) Transcript_24442:926-1273(+)